MLTKILIFVGVIVGVFVVARLGASSAFKPAKASKRKSKLARESEDMIACTVCGAYVAKGEACTCGGAPTP